MARVWVSGPFEGWYKGTLEQDSRARGAKKTYVVELFDGFLESPTILEQPPSDGLFDVSVALRQDELRTTLRGAGRTFMMRDLRVSDWRTDFHTEDKGEVFGTIFGTACGWVDDGKPTPKPPSPPPQTLAASLPEPQPAPTAPSIAAVTQPATASVQTGSLTRAPKFAVEPAPTGCAMALVLGVVGMTIFSLAVGSPVVLGLLVAATVLWITASLFRYVARLLNTSVWHLVLLAAALGALMLIFAQIA